MPKTIIASVHAEQVIRKSRFIGCVQAVADRPAADAVVASLRASHPQANHVCWAMLAGGHSAAVDDGEPGGTAGRPILEILQHHELSGVLATVVRYFGGVRRGAGGLVRAYGSTVARCLAQAELVVLRPMSTLRATVPYSFENAVRHLLTAHDNIELAVAHSSQGAELTIQLPSDQAEFIRDRISDLCRGRARWQGATDQAGRPPDGT